METRTATYIGTLVYMDEPQLITLRSYRTRIVAVAVPSEVGKAEFLATSVSSKNWSDYLDGFVDLRYLFTFAEKKTLYTFDLLRLKDNKIRMDRVGEVSEEMLPKPHFFSRSHTEEDEDEIATSEETQTIYVDGEWDLPDFGSFYSRYSDVYYFISSVNDLSDESISGKGRSSVADAFRDKAFRGGFSYVHFYGSLASSRPRAQRLNMNEISYASPGHVSILGDDLIFGEVKDAIIRYLSSRDKLRNDYNRFYDMLSKARLLAIAGDNFPKDSAQAKRIYSTARRLAEALEIPNIDYIYRLVDHNALVFAKVVLSFQRRLEEASRFFAQGRMAFERS